MPCAVVVANPLVGNAPVLKDRDDQLRPPQNKAVQKRQSKATDGFAPIHLLLCDVDGAAFESCRSKLSVHPSDLANRLVEHPTPICGRGGGRLIACAVLAEAPHTASVDARCRRAETLPLLLIHFPPASSATFHRKFAYNKNRYSESAYTEGGWSCHQPMPKARFTDAYASLLRELILLRRKAGVSQLELARRLGTKQQLVSRIERGDRRVDVIEFYAIVKAVGADPEAVFSRVIRPLPDYIEI